MTANELEVEPHKLAGRLDAELQKLAGKGEADVQRLTAEDRVLNGRMTNAEAKAVAIETAGRETDRKIEDIRIELGVLKQAVEQLKADRDRWGGRMWGLFAAAVGIIGGALVTAVVTVLLALAGFKRG
jgi:hypothetical protein